MDDWYGKLDHTMPELVRRSAALHGERPFVVGEDGESLTFRDTLAHVERIALALLENGIEPGDRVAIWAPNSSRWILAALAIESIGAAMVPLNTRFKAAEAAYILGKSRVRGLFLVRNFLGNDYFGMLKDELAQLPELDLIVALDDALEADAMRSWSSLVERRRDVAAARAAMAAVRWHQTCDILFTSGTTGRPKGAMHSHGQAIWMAGIWNRSNDLRADDRALIVNPFFHSFGYRAGWVSALLAGMTCYPQAIFDVDRVMATIARERISVLMGPPTLFSSILDHPHRAEYDLSSLRIGHTGSSNVPVTLVERAREELAFELFLTSYGLTEATALVTVCWPSDTPETIARTVGRPLPGVELRIVDRDRRNVPQGDGGELLVRGPNVMQGYFEDEGATAAIIDSEGWLATGDVGAIGADGTLRILDRLKDVVIVAGFNAYPAEIEHVLAQHPSILEVAVIAAPDERMGEVTAACAVLREGATLTLQELVDWSRPQMANFKVPRHLFIRDSLPRTPLGKIQKFELKKEVLASLASSEGRDPA